jgi:hypothetical protein
MKNYIKEIEFASKSLINLISADFTELAKLKKSFEVLNPEQKIKHQSFMANEYHSSANFYHAQMAEAFERKKSADNEKLSEVLLKIDAKSASITALSCALLQIAKQGISTCYGKPQNAPKGTEFNGVLVKDIIWEARNQSNHYENPKEISIHVENIFLELDKIRNDGIKWDPNSKFNFAFEVIQLLGWLKYENFEKHLCSIRPK